LICELKGDVKSDGGEIELRSQRLDARKIEAASMRLSFISVCGKILRYRWCGL